MTIRVRFAPSPTGALHIGGARTALFNFLYAKHMKGKFLLRIEDTDKERSTKESTQAILDGLSWLDITPDEPVIFQSSYLSKHQEIAKKLVEIGAAYYCYTPPEELQKLREENEKKGFKFQSPWRDGSSTPPKGVTPVVRLKAPPEGSTEIADLIQGTVVVKNSQIDDMVLLRADGSPTYMLAVVVDDHDMEITHVIRGDEHFNNTFRQYHVYKALGWEAPAFAHIPLIHGKDGAKLSKRHGALGLNYYQDEGYLPEAINNYLLRLGWGHGDNEIISREQAIEWFDIKNVKKSPARLDFDKLLHLNAHYIKEASNEHLVSLLKEKFTEVAQLPEEKLQTLQVGLEQIKLRAKTLNELFEQSQFYVSSSPIQTSPDAKKFIKDFDDNTLQKIHIQLNNLPSWTTEDLKYTIEKFLQENNLKMKDVARVLRALLTGTTSSPSVFEIMEVLGKDETLIRLKQQV